MLETGNKTMISTTTIVLQYYTEVLTSASRQKKKNESVRNGKEETRITHR